MSDEQLAPVTECQNCGVPVTGRFCAACGVEHEENRLLPVASLCGELVREATEWDSRLIGTFRALLTAPGKLTTEYVHGRRGRYFRPLKLYLVLSAIFYIFASMAEPIVIQLNPLDLKPGFRVLYEARGMSVEIFRDRVNSTANDLLPLGAFLLVPIYALALKVLIRKPRRYFHEHFVFALHQKTFAAVVGMMLMPIDWLNTQGYFVATWVAQVVYQFIAMRRHYGLTWWGVLWRTAITQTVHLICLMLMVLFLAGAAVGMVLFL